jgi:hypothetical protein
MIFLFNERARGRGVGIALLFLLLFPGCAAKQKPLPPPGETFGRYRFNYESSDLPPIGVAQIFDDCERTFINLQDPSAQIPSIKIGKRRVKPQVLSGLIFVEGVHPEMTLVRKADVARVINRNGPCTTQDSEEVKIN